MDAALQTRRPAAPPGSALTTAACAPAEEVLAGLESGPDGLTAPEAARRRAAYGPNAVATHGARLGSVLGQQLRSPLLGLLVAAATASYFVGERTDAVIIGVIVAAVGRARLRQRVPGREGGRGAALADQRTRRSSSATAEPRRST